MWYIPAAMLSTDTTARHLAVEGLLAYIRLGLSLLLQRNGYLVDDGEVNTHIVINQIVVARLLQYKVELHWVSGEHHTILSNLFTLGHEHDPIVGWEWGPSQVTPNNGHRVHESLSQQMD